jgi:hypothetical protein
MPITILNKEYTDIYGNTKTYYESNAGDITEVEILVMEQILVISNATNYLQFNELQDTIVSSSIDWLKEGFRVGNPVGTARFTSGGALIGLYGANVVNIYGTNNNTIQLSALNAGAVPDVTAGQYFAIWDTNTGNRFEEIVLNVNQVQTGTAGSQYSPIDGEATRFIFDIKNAPNFPFFPANQVIQSTAINNKSGQYTAIAELITTTDSPLLYGGTIAVGYVNKIRIKLINSGILTPSLFFVDKCLKPYFKLEYARYLGEPFNRSTYIITDDANTGFFNEAYNIGNIDATLIQGITNLAYDAPTTGQIIVESATPTSDVALGLSYVPINDAYYRNRPYTQSELGFTIPSTPTFVLGTPTTSPTNEYGANYTIEVTNTTIVGTTITIDFTFTPNSFFDNFFSNVDEGDRLFYVWVKVGSVNLLAFSGQLESNPPIGGLIDMVQNVFIDHSQNYTDSNVTATGYEANIEDDLAFIGKFRLPYDEIVESFTARLEAYNTATDDSFTLSSTFFSFSSIPMVGGKYILNENTNVINTLPTTSEKRNATLYLEPSIDTAGEYGVKIYYPFLFRWEYWLPQLNASADFYPNQQTKDYFPYDTTGDWTIRLHLEKVVDNLAYTFDDDLTIKYYDSAKEIYQYIDVYRVSTGQLVNVLVTGEMHRVDTYHELLNGQVWDGNVWGQITIEPTESAPRWLISTIVPHDFNPANPFTPISGNYAELTFLSPTLIKISAYFNANNIDLTNGAKFTTKIKGCSVIKEIVGKITTYGDIKETTNDDIKIISI